MRTLSCQLEFWLREVSEGGKTSSVGELSQYQEPSADTSRLASEVDGRLVWFGWYLRLSKRILGLGIYIDIGRSEASLIEWVKFKVEDGDGEEAESAG